MEKEALETRFTRHLVVVEFVFCGSYADNDWSTQYSLYPIQAFLNGMVSADWRHLVSDFRFVNFRGIDFDHALGRLPGSVSYVCGSPKRFAFVNCEITNYDSIVKLAMRQGPYKEPLCEIALSGGGSVITNLRGSKAPLHDFTVEHFCFDCDKHLLHAIDDLPNLRKLGVVLALCKTCEAGGVTLKEMILNTIGESTINNPLFKFYPSVSPPC